MVLAATLVETHWLPRLFLATFTCSVALAAHLRTKERHKSSVPHVTYFVFDGRVDNCMAEFALSAYTLCRNTPSAQVLVVTDQPERGKIATKKLNEVCWDGEHQASYVEVDASKVRGYFHSHGYTHLHHEAGIGGYARALAEKLIPEDIERTIVVDTDTLFNQDITDMWSMFDDFSRMEVLSAKPMQTEKNSCFRPGERFNFGMVMMELSHMRKLNWTQFVLDKAESLMQEDEKGCGYCVEDTGLLCGDGDLVSFACKKMAGRCGQLEPWFHSDYCNDPEDVEPADGWEHDKDPMLFHFNCGEGYRDCPDKRCRKVVDDFFRLNVNPFSRRKKRED